MPPLTTPPLTTPPLTAPSSQPLVDPRILPPMAALADAPAVLAALAALPSGAVIATDADETLWAADVGDEVVKMASEGLGPFPKGAADFAWYAREMATGDYAHACRFAALLLAQVDAEAVRSAMTPTLAKITVRRWLVDALREAMQRGVSLVIVSASPLPVVRWAADLHGLGAALVIGIEAHLGGVQEPAPVGFGKVDAWHRLGLTQPHLALGDSRWDGPLLQMAKHGFLLEKASKDTFAV